MIDSRPAVALLFGILTLALRTDAQSTYVPVSFYPSVGGAAGATGAGVRIWDSLVPIVPVTAQFCRTDAYPPGGPIAGPSGVSVTVFCRGVDVAPGSRCPLVDPNQPQAPPNDALGETAQSENVDIFDRPCVRLDLETLATDARELQVSEIDTSAFVFSYFECPQLELLWYTRVAGNEPELANQVCNLAVQCFFSQGLAKSRLDDPVSPLENSEYLYYCCRESSVITGGATLAVREEITCVFQPQQETGGEQTSGCGDRNSMDERCVRVTSYEASVNEIEFDDGPGSNTEYQCDYSCVFPCVTSLDLDLPGCDEGSRTQGCPPSAHNSQCTVNLNTESARICGQNGGDPVSFLERTVVAGEDDMFIENFVQLCVDGDVGCSEPECRCLGADGCPSHARCNGRGTFYQSLDVAVNDVCVCFKGSFGRFCEFETKNIDCNNGQEVSTGVV